MPPTALADWTSPQLFALPELGPGVEGEAKVASWWRHVQPLQALPLPVDLIVSGSADAERLAGSRWHGISEAARQGRVLVVRPS